MKDTEIWMSTQENRKTQQRIYCHFSYIFIQTFSTVLDLFPFFSFFTLSVRPPLCLCNFCMCLFNSSRRNNKKSVEKWSQNYHKKSYKRKIMARSFPQKNIKDCFRGLFVWGWILPGNKSNWRIFHIFLLTIWCVSMAQ